MNASCASFFTSPLPPPRLTSGPIRCPESDMTGEDVAVAAIASARRPFAAAVDAPAVTAEGAAAAPAPLRLVGLSGPMLQSLGELSSRDARL